MSEQVEETKPAVKHEGPTENNGGASENRNFGGNRRGGRGGGRFSQGRGGPQHVSEQFYIHKYGVRNNV